MNSQIEEIIRDREELAKKLRQPEVDALKKQIAAHRGIITALDSANAALKAENERLRKDAERYQHVRSVGGCVWHVTNNPSGYVLATGDIYDAAVDAAINLEKIELSPPEPPPSEYGKSGRGGG